MGCYIRTVVERKVRGELQGILGNIKHPLHDVLISQRSSCSEQLISLRCRTERFRRSFVPAARRLTETSNMFPKLLYY